MHPLVSFQPVLSWCSRMRFSCWPTLRRTSLGDVGHNLIVLAHPSAATTWCTSSSFSWRSGCCCSGGVLVWCGGDVRLFFRHRSCWLPFLASEVWSNPGSPGPFGLLSPIATREGCCGRGHAGLSVVLALAPHLVRAPSLLVRLWFFLLSGGRGSTVPAPPLSIGMVTLPVRQCGAGTGWRDTVPFP